MLPLTPVQTERWILRRRIRKAELASSLKPWNLRRTRLRFHRPPALQLPQVGEKTFVVALTFVSTFSLGPFVVVSDLIISPRSLRYRDTVLKNS